MYIINFVRNCISSVRKLAYLVFRRVYHHCERKYSLRLMICTFGDDIRLRRWYAIAFAMNKKILQKMYPFLQYFLASTRGFEPPTYCLGGSCSILLSYVDIIVLLNFEHGIYFSILFSLFQVVWHFLVIDRADFLCYNHMRTRVRCCFLSIRTRGEDNLLARWRFFCWNFKNSAFDCR